MKNQRKSNHAEASLRQDSLPKSEKVTEVDAEKHSRAAVKSAHRQNSSLKSDGSRFRNVLPIGANKLSPKEIQQVDAFEPDYGNDSTAI